MRSKIADARRYHKEEQQKKLLGLDLSGKFARSNDLESSSRS